MYKVIIYKLVIITSPKPDKKGRLRKYKRFFRILETNIDKKSFSSEYIKLYNIYARDSSINIDFKEIDNNDSDFIIWKNQIVDKFKLLEYKEKGYKIEGIDI